MCLYVYLDKERGNEATQKTREGRSVGPGRTVSWKSAILAL